MLFSALVIPIISFTAVHAMTLSSLQRFWRCSGPFSNLQYRDCEGKYYNTTGCYFLPHFAQYRACAAICNDVTVHTIAEMKCRSYCSGYLKSCRIAQATTLPLPTPKSSRSTDAAENSHRNGNKSLGRSAWTVLYCLISSVALIILVSVAVVIRRRMARAHRNGGLQRVTRGVQELDDVTEDEGDDSEHTAIVAYTSDIK